MAAGTVIVIPTALPTGETLISWLAVLIEACRHLRAPKTTLRESRMCLWRALLVDKPKQPKL